MVNPTCKPVGGLAFSIAGPEEANDIFEFLMKNFFPVVPIGQIVEMDVDLEVRPWAQSFVRATVEQGHTLVVRDTSAQNQIVAVCLVQVEDNKSVPNTILDLVDPEKHPLMLMNAVFLDTLADGVDFFTMYGVDRIMDITIIAVGNLYASRGLAFQLVQLTVDRAKTEMGIRIFKTEAVSEYAARALRKAGFSTIKEIPYEDFEYRGTRPLAPLAQQTAHKKGQLMVYTI